MSDFRLELGLMSYSLFHLGHGCELFFRIGVEHLKALRYIYVVHCKSATKFNFLKPQIKS